MKSAQVVIIACSTAHASHLKTSVYRERQESTRRSRLRITIATTVKIQQRSVARTIANNFDLVTCIQTFSSGDLTTVAVVQFPSKSGSWPTSFSIALMRSTSERSCGAAPSSPFSAAGMPKRSLPRQTSYRSATRVLSSALSRTIHSCGNNSPITSSLAHLWKAGPRLAHRPAAARLRCAKIL